jgi:hypothetical protein
MSGFEPPKLMRRRRGGRADGVARVEISCPAADGAIAVVEWIIGEQVYALDGLQLELDGPWYKGPSGQLGAGGTRAPMPGDCVHARSFHARSFRESARCMAAHNRGLTD